MFRSKMRGFSLLEAMVVLAIIMISSAIFFINLMPALNQVHVTNAYNTVLSSIRRAHDQAVSQRRIYVVSFLAPRTINVTQNTDTGPLLFSIDLPDDLSFNAEPGLPVVAPDNFGGGKTAIDFAQGVASGQKDRIYFYPDGSALDVNKNVNNGVVYLSRPGDLWSSRAITVWGATGRIRGWRLDSNSSGVLWRQQ
jgi:Tfp pilus assembly protein FimT